MTRIGYAVLASVLLIAPVASAQQPPVPSRTETPLRVSDTSSPRATLQGFIKTTDDLYTRWADLLTSHWDSGELYPTLNQRKLQTDILGSVPNAVHPLNMSEVPPVELGTVGAERAVQLREILDRIALPPMQDVPDAAAMANQPAKRWRLPDTEIDFALVQQGPRAGEYLVSPETVRMPIGSGSACQRWPGLSSFPCASLDARRRLNRISSPAMKPPIPIPIHCRTVAPPIMALLQSGQFSTQRSGMT